MADGTIVIDVKVNDDALDHTDQKIKNTEKSAGASSIGIGKIATSLGLVKVASGAFDVLKGGMDGAISRFDTMNRFPKIMEQMGFSTEDTDKSIRTLSDGIDGLPTKLDDVVKNTQQMAMTTGDLDKSSKVVLGLNNAFLASGSGAEDAERGMTQFNQALSRGKFEGEEWNTMKETMGIGLKELATEFGYTGQDGVQKLYDALQNGDVTMDQFTDKLALMGDKSSKMGQLAISSSEGIATSFNNLGNAVSKNMANILTSIDNLIQRLTGKNIAQWLDSLKGVINETGEAVQRLIDSFGKLPQVLPFTPLTMIIFMFENIGSHLGTLKTAFETAFASIGTALAGIQEPVTKVMFSLNQLLDVFLTALEKITPAVGSFVGSLITAFGTLLPAVQPFIDVLKTLVQIAGEILPPIMEALGSIIEGVASAIAPIMTDIGNALKVIVDVIAKWIETAVVPTLQSFADWCGDNKDTIANVAGIVLSLAVAFKTFNTAVSLFSATQTILSGLGVVLGSLTGGAGALSGALGSLSGALGFLLNPITLVVGALFLITGAFVRAIVGPKKFKEMIDSVLEGLNPINWIKRGDEIAAGVGRAFAELGSGIAEKTGQAVTDAGNNFSKMKDDAIGKGNEIKDGIGRAFSEMGSGIAGKMGEVGNSIRSGFEDAKGHVDRIAEDIKQAVLSIGDIDLFQKGKDIVTGLYNGLVDGFNSFIGGISKMGSDIANAFHGKSLAPNTGGVQDTGQAGVPTFADDSGIMAMKTASVRGGGFLGQVSNAMGSALSTPVRAKSIKSVPTPDKGKAVNVTVTNEIHAEWDGKTNIKQTMQEMQTQTIKDLRGAIGGMV